MIFLTTDLLFTSRVAGAAARAGLSLQTVASGQALLELMKSLSENRRVEHPPWRGLSPFVESSEQKGTVPLSAGGSRTGSQSADANPLVLLDLNTPGVDPGQLVPALRSAANPPRTIIAYGPHVQEERLAAATAAGCDEVLTRGQFNAHMDEMLRKWRQSRPG